MKNNLIFYVFFLTFGCILQSCDTLEPPKDGTEMINIYVEPNTIYNANGGSFTVSVTSDWTGPNSSPLRILVTRDFDACNAYFNNDADNITKTNKFSKTINTSDFTYTNGCTGPEFIYTITVIVIASSPQQTITASFSWYGGGITILNANIEKGILSNVANFGYESMNNNIASALSTFRNPNSDSYVNITTQTNNNNQGYTYPGQNFINAPTNDEMHQQIFDYIVGPPSIHIDPTNYPYLLAYGNHATYNTQNYPNAITAGVALNLYAPEPYTGIANFSIIFVHNIREWCNIPPILNFTSVINQTTAHELTHQLGNVYEHGNHNTQPACVLNTLDFFENYNNVFNQLTTQYILCQNHINSIRNNLGGGTLTLTNEGNRNNTLRYYRIDTNDIQRKVLISLPKYNYKTYEPINLTFEWINLQNNKDSIWGLFDQGCDFLKCYIEDEKGNFFNKKNKILNSYIGFREPEYILNARDTIRRYITINDFAKPIQSKTENYFGNLGYFPVGKYKLYFIIDEDYGKKFVKPIKTNEIEFEISEINEFDSQILDLVRDRKYDVALTRFPNYNYFDEYLRYFSLNKYLGEYLSDKFEHKAYDQISTLLVKYDDFFKEFYNSQYILNDIFMYHYFSIGSEEYSSLLSKVNNLMGKYPTTNIEYILNDVSKREKFIKKFTNDQRLH